MKDIKQSIAGCIRRALEKYAPGGDVPSSGELAGALAYPPDSSMGDLAFPCFKLSRALRRSPNAIADLLLGELESSVPEGIGKVQSVGGYLNFFISDGYYENKIMPEILSKGAAYGADGEGEGKTVVLDYSSPNVAKPFHIGHLGTTVIGHSLKMLHEYEGYKCIGVNHLGDWGTQFGKVMVAFRKWGDDKALEEGGVDYLVSLYVRFHEEAEANPELDDEARTEFTKLERHDPENMKLWKRFIDISLPEYKRLYDMLGISFDSYAGESFYSDKMDEQVNFLREKGLLKIDNGASIVDLSEYGMPPCLVLKSDGSTLYPARDIAAAVYRKRTYDFDKCVYVTSAGQSLHFAQWFKVVELMGYDWYKGLVHVPYGTVSLDGKKLSTRTGNVVILKDLFNDAVEKVKGIIDAKNPALENKEDTAVAVGVGAIIFYYLSGNRIRDINFVYDDAFDFDGNTGPYAQYTYARTCSLLSKAGDAAGYAGYDGKLCNEERALCNTLSLFSEKVHEALDAYEPSVITRYILGICNCFNRFYQACPILSATDEARGFRVALTRCTHDILGKALELICLRHPDKI